MLNITVVGALFGGCSGRRATHVQNERLHNPPQHADAGLHRLARLNVGVYFAAINGRVARRG